MSHDYKMVTWTPFKKKFDIWLAVGVLVYLGVFTAVSMLTPPPGETFTPVQVLIRATGSLSFLLLVFILSIGPLARLSDRMKPFLYNRRHLGVTAFLLALTHAGLVVFWYHGFSELNPIVSLLVSNPRYTSIAGFPFEILGFFALSHMFLMAATSHDFWNANLGPGLWKAIHMGVYVMFTLLVGHVSLGVIQSEKDPIYLILVAVAAGGVTLLHLVTAVLGAVTSRAEVAPTGWLDAGLPENILDGRAVVLTPSKGERIAVFRDGQQIYALSNVCRHQGGPLGEGRILDACITCPWHGFQYRMEDGCSPPPFTEKISTYATRIVDGRVLVNPVANAPGTPQAPSIMDPRYP